MRRGDFANSRSDTIPSFGEIGLEVEKKLQEYKLKKVYVATDGTQQGMLRRYFKNLVHCESTCFSPENAFVYEKLKFLTELHDFESLIGLSRYSRSQFLKLIFVQWNLLFFITTKMYYRKMYRDWFDKTNSC